MKTSLTSAPFHGEPDLQAMIDLLAASRAPDRHDEHPSPSSLREMLSVPAHQEGVRLWRDADARLAGFALVDVRYCNLYWEIHPAASSLGLESEIMRWASQYLPLGRRAWGLATDNLTLDASCRSDDVQRIALLEAHGFQGGECRRATARFRTALGQDSDEQLKPEFTRQAAEGTLNVSGGQAPQA